MGSNRNKKELLRQKRKEKKRRKFIIAGLIILGAGALFTLAIMLPKIILDRTKLNDIQGFSLGDPEAPVTVIQFSSYSCGFCKSFSEAQEPDFISRYVDSGQVFFRFVNIPSNDPASQLAAKASYCAADQDRFFDYRNYLYEFSGSPDGFSEENLLSYAEAAGLETGQFQTCLEGNTFATAYIDDIQYAQKVGVTFTPSFLVNDQLVGADELIPKVDELLGQKAN